jgi:hypothetical protein
MITVHMNWTPTTGSSAYAVSGSATPTPDSGVKAGAAPHKVAGTPGTGKIRPGAGEA